MNYTHLKCGLRFRAEELPITPNGNCVRTQNKDKPIFNIEGNELIEGMPSVKSRILNFRIECPQIYS